ncbi:hypothetical protein PPEP_a0407 [Pseudoalteromonas peptidolytica F12-50-A1]|uniref:Uncharacterized protein n=1 Tax=Pseudoalteromonas peptidolytica F12-50-A1 TaxID=1315280 RepID=A0A8I0MTG1_9GAMM|nr:hypothetical protein [Pseudoalteromonas peptidolytica F12-50-A1]
MIEKVHTSPRTFLTIFGLIEVIMLAFLVIGIHYGYSKVPAHCKARKHD